MLMVIALYLFNSLTVTVDNEKICASFGPGLIKRTIQFRVVKSAEKVKNKWYYGFGIRLVPGGQMYNVAGMDAIELKLTNGRVFRIGTDEPNKLLQIVQDQL